MRTLSVERKATRHLYDRRLSQRWWRSRSGVEGGVKTLGVRGKSGSASGSASKRQYCEGTGHTGNRTETVDHVGAGAGEEYGVGARRGTVPRSTPRRE